MKVRKYHVKQMGFRCPWCGHATRFLIAHTNARKLATVRMRSPFCDDCSDHDIGMLQSVEMKLENVPVTMPVKLDEKIPREDVLEQFVIQEHLRVPGNMLLQ